MTHAPLQIRPFTAADTEALVALWQVCGLTRPWNDPHTDIACRMMIDDDLFLLGHVVDSPPSESASPSPSPLVEAETETGTGTKAAAAAEAGIEDEYRDASRAASSITPSNGVLIVSTLVACAMGGYDGHRGWVYYVGSHPEHRGQGHARLMMDELERRLRGKGCPKINLQVRDDNEDAIAFYEHLGYAVDKVVGLGKRLTSADSHN